MPAAPEIQQIDPYVRWRAAGQLPMDLSHCTQLHYYW